MGGPTDAYSKAAPARLQSQPVGSWQKRTLRSVATGASQLVSVNRCHSPRRLLTKLGYDSHRERGVEQLPSKSIGTLPICLALGLRDDWGSGLGYIDARKSFSRTGDEIFFLFWKAESEVWFRPWVVVESEIRLKEMSLASLFWFSMIPSFSFSLSS